MFTVTDDDEGLRQMVNHKGKLGQPIGWTPFPLPADFPDLVPFTAIELEDGRKFWYDPRVNTLHDEGAGL